MKRILYILSLLLIAVMPARAGEPKAEDESVDVKGIIFEYSSIIIKGLHLINLSIYNLPIYTA